MNWTSILIVGALLLAAVIALIAFRSKTGVSPGDTEAATREIYEEEDRAHRGESDNVP